PGFRRRTRRCWRAGAPVTRSSRHRPRPGCPCWPRAARRRDWPSRGYASSSRLRSVSFAESASALTPRPNGWPVASRRQWPVAAPGSTLLWTVARALSPPPEFLGAVAAAGLLLAVWRWACKDLVAPIVGHVVADLAL